MCNAWNHPPDCTCGWGGEGHLGGGDAGGGTLGGESPRWIRDGNALRWLNTDDLCRPTACPICKNEVYFVRHNGGSVWFDDLGWPWPKHPCFGGDLTSLMRGTVSECDSSNTTPVVSAAFADLVHATWNARVGLVKWVVALGDRLRVMEIVTSDGTLREAALEKPVSVVKLIGAIAVCFADDWRVWLVVDGVAVQGWWYDQPPGEWQEFDPAHAFVPGEITYYDRQGSGGVGVVVDVSGFGQNQKVKTLLVSGKTKTFHAATAGLLWLSRTKIYEPLPIMTSQVEASSNYAAAPTRAPAKPKERCPYCGYRVKKLGKHISIHHREQAP